MPDQKFTLETFKTEIFNGEQSCDKTIVIATVRDPNGVIICESTLKTLPGYNMEIIFVNMFKQGIKSLKMK